MLIYIYIFYTLLNKKLPPHMTSRTLSGVIKWFDCCMRPIFLACLNKPSHPTTEVVGFEPTSVQLFY